ncbi:putative lipoprotein precursor [Vibrio ponticus]|nr:putative lipoprotein precursor [Vibrio ponticus]
MKVKLLVMFSTLLALMGCGTQLDDYKQSSPNFALFDYFQGDVKAWGIVQDFSGKKTRSFEVDIVGTIEGNKLTLVEDFIYSDGVEEQRIWNIERLEDGSYQGTAQDIIGTATGAEQGNAMRWQYDFELPYDGSTITVAMDDWLFRQDDKHLFNITKVKKFGVQVATVTIFFQKQ